MDSSKKGSIFIFILILVFIFIPILNNKYQLKKETIKTMADPNWGLLEKSQTDNETIEQAITRLIVAHDDDANAHIGAGKSLDTHKTQSVVDHPADSIVEDKILTNTVSVEKRKWDQMVIETLFESLDGWNQYTTLSSSIYLWIASLRLTTGATPGAVARIQAETFSEGWGVNFLKNPRFMTTVRLSPAPNQVVNIMAGGDFTAFGFKAVGTTLYAFHRKDILEVPTDYTTEILTPFGVWIKLEAIYTSGVKIEFYLDNVLVATHTTNLPEDGDTIDNLNLMEYYIATTVANSTLMFIRNLNFTQNE